MRARDMAPEIDDELQLVDERLGFVRRRLEEMAGPAPVDPSGADSLYGAVTSPDDPVSEARLAAVMTLQVHVTGARRDLFGGEPAPAEQEVGAQGEETVDEYDEPVPAIEDAEELRQAVDDVVAALDAARKRLRELPR